MPRTSDVQCPPALLEAARGFAPLRTAVVNAGTDVVLESVRDCVEAGLIEPLLRERKSGGEGKRGGLGGRRRIKKKTEDE